jgi:hypothetical protein
MDKLPNGSRMPPPLALMNRANPKKILKGKRDGKQGGSSVVITTTAAG